MHVVPRWAVPRNHECRCSLRCRGPCYALRMAIYSLSDRHLGSGDSAAYINLLHNMWISHGRTRGFQTILVGVADNDPTHVIVLNHRFDRSKTSRLRQIVWNSGSFGSDRRGVIGLFFGSRRLCPRLRDCPTLWQSIHCNALKPRKDSWY